METYSFGNDLWHLSLSIILRFTRVLVCIINVIPYYCQVVVHCYSYTSLN